MVDCEAAAKALRDHRPLLLAMEAVGWLHMAGKASARFLREHGGQKTGYDYKTWHENENPPFPWDDLLQWVSSGFPLNGSSDAWPDALTDFIEKHTKKSKGLLGLLQAGHAMASGIEKQSYPEQTVKYLGQDATHMWLASAFGHPVRNLLVDPPETLTDTGWTRLVAEIQRILTQLRDLGLAHCKDIRAWWDWREAAIGRGSLLRNAFTATVAETRLPNNDVTLWDQSYVAAALFKSALAGAILEGQSFPWADNSLKQTTRWRLLTIGIGADHYEARAVRIGDWTGARLALDDFFERVRKLIEVDLAVGSLLYADGDVVVFSFPGERDGGRACDASSWTDCLQRQIDEYAEALDLETPPVCRISDPTRSLVKMSSKIRDTRGTLKTPVHRPWKIKNAAEKGHVCPVCLGRHSGSPTDKQAPCEVCKKRRRHRLEHWLQGKYGSDTIWITEVADSNDRLALLTFSLDIDPWLEGSRVDSLRTQAIPEWRRHIPTLEEYWKRDVSRRNKISNPIEPTKPFDSLLTHIQAQLASKKENDLVLGSLQDGFRRASDWPTFFDSIVEDRAHAPSWNSLNNDYERAH